MSNIKLEDLGVGQNWKFEYFNFFAKYHISTQRQSTTMKSISINMVYINAGNEYSSNGIGVFDYNSNCQSIVPDTGSKAYHFSSTTETQQPWFL